MPSIEWDTVGRALRLVGLGILAIVVAASALYAVPQLVGAEHSYVVLSGSMQPAIGPGDVILVDAVDIEAVEPGDVVTFNRGEGAPTTHRVLETVQTDGGPALRTKGDANEEPDPGLVHQSQLVGRVMSLGGVLLVIPAFGYVVEFANSGQGAVLIVFVPLTLLVLNEIYTRLDRPEEADEATTPHPQGLGEPTVPPDPVLGGTAPAAEIPTRSRSSSGSSSGSGGAADESVSVGHMDLTLTLLVLAVVVPYSGWMLVRTQTTPSAMVFAGGFVGLALVGYGRARLWLAARKADGSDESDGGGGGGISIRGNGDAGQGAVEIKSGADSTSAGDGEAPNVADGPRPNWPEQSKPGAGTDAPEGVQ